MAKDIFTTWVVATTGDDLTGDGTLALPYLTIGKAISVAGNYDTIHVLPGTYDEQVVITQKYLTLEGEGDTTIISKTLAVDTHFVITMTSGCTVRNLKAIAGTTGCPLTAGISSSNVTIEGCYLVGKFDGLNIHGSRCAIVRNCKITAIDHGVLAIDAFEFTIDNCDISTDGSWSDAAVGIRGIQAINARGVIRNSRISVSRISPSTSHPVTGIEQTTASGNGHVLVYNCEVYAAGVGTGVTAGIASNDTITGPLCLTMIGGGIFSATAGGTAYDIDANAGGKVCVSGVNYDATKVRGTVLQVLTPTVAGRTADIAVDGEIGLDFNNIHDAAAPKTLTNITVPTVTTTGTATALGTTPQGILDKLDATFESSGVFDAGSLANAPTGGGMSGGQEAKLDAVVASTAALVTANNDAPTTQEFAQLVSTEMVVFNTGETAAVAGSAISLATGSGGSDGAGLDDDYTGSHADGTVGNLYQILAMAIPNASPGTNGGIATGANVDAVTIEGVMALTDLDEERITPEFIWNCISHPTLGIISHEKLTLRIGSPQTFGWRFPLAKNVRILIVDTPTIFSGTGSGVTFGSTGRESPTAKCRLTGISAGTYELDVQIVTDGGSTLTARTTLIVTN